MSQQPKPSWYSAMRGRVFGRAPVAQAAVQVLEQSGFAYGDALTTQALIGGGGVQARARQIIYAKYQQMMSDPIVSGCLRIHVTSALGGDDATGEMVFIEAAAEAKKGKGGSQSLVEEIARDLGPLFNRIAFIVAYNGVGFGDAYARLYAKRGVGIVDAICDEMLLPPLIQPYSQGNKTTICEVAVGDKYRERLEMFQIARLKMPRMQYTPQPMAIEKAWRTRISEDDIDKLPHMPDLVGGSFLADAEKQYDNFAASLLGLVGQRVLDSIDETVFTAHCAGMTAEQRQTFLASVKQMLERSKKIAEDAVKSGVPFLQRIRHILPVWNDKQLVQVQAINGAGGSGAGRSGTISVEDILLHAKLLAGSMGIDLSMLGFADLMSGGLGEGGFLRTSIQSAERSRTIRVALTDFFNHIVDVHLAYKKNIHFAEGERPWQVRFHGSNIALAAEEQRKKNEGHTATQLLLQVLQQAKDLGLDEKATAHLLEREAGLSAEDAKMYAKAVVEAKKKEAAERAAEGGFGGPPGFDGGGGGDEPSAPEDEDRKKAMATPIKH